jgi:squalene-associated FAD-dependent desaturase
VSRKAVVVGGGWAGLAAAVTAGGMRTTLLESAPRLGGRARTVDTPLGALDNGQHLLIGAYRAFLDLLATLGVAENTLLDRRTLCMRMSDLAGGREVVLDVPALPAPLHLAKGLGSARGLSVGERLAAVRFTGWLQRRGFDIDDRPLAGLLTERRQPAHLTRALWEPLCLATLNTPLARASARLFAVVLQKTFTGHRSHCDLLLPRAPTRRRGALRHARGRAGVPRRAGHRCTPGRRHANRLRRRGAGAAAARAGTAARRPRRTRLPAGEAVALRIPADLRYPHAVDLDGPLRGVLGGATQWLIDRAGTGQPGVISAVVSAEGPHMALARDALASQVAAEVARLFPTWPAPVERLVIREKRATFASVAGVEALRPGCATQLPGCWLAGDWTATGLPATLEGAVSSGVQSAHAIAATRHPQA